MFQFKPFALAMLAALAVTTTPTGQAQASRNDATVAVGRTYQIVIVEVEGCIYCEVLRRDALPVFAASPQARDIEVRFLDLNTPAAKVLQLVDGPLTTVPTVILVDGNREVARAEGYMGPDGFMRSLAWMISNAH